MKTLRVPTVHKNGTSEVDLLDRYEAAFYALTESLERLRHTAPNPRDFYVQSPEAIHEATSQHQDRMTRIATVIDELQALQTGVLDRIDCVDVEQLSQQRTECLDRIAVKLNTEAVATLCAADPHLVRIMKERDILMSALSQIAKHESYPGSGVCIYGCDTPNIAQQAIDQINKG